MVKKDQNFFQKISLKKCALMHVANKLARICLAIIDRHMIIPNETHYYKVNGKFCCLVTISVSVSHQQS